MPLLLPDDSIVGPLNMYTECKRFAERMVECSEMIQNVRSEKAVKVYPRDFAPHVPELRCTTLSTANGGSLLSFSLSEFLDGKNGDPETAKYTELSLWLNGSTDVGKSALLHAIAREICTRHNFDRYLFGKELDGVGLITKSGLMRALGCFCFTDFVMESLQNTHLCEENIKGLCKVDETAHYTAR